MTDWTIKALWVGDTLTKIEQLSLASFIYNGHTTELFCYQDIVGLPDGVIVRDVNEILPETEIFKYKARPSYAGFANWFRYEMLYKEGGMWADMDVVCLRAIDMDRDLVVGWEEHNKVNCAVTGGLAGDPLFRWMSDQCSDPNKILPYDNHRARRRKRFRRYLAGNQRGNVRWGETGPVGFTKALRHFERLGEVLPVTAFYPIHPSCWNTIFDSTYPSAERYFPDSYAIHLWNEMMRQRQGFNKNATYPADSLIEALKRKYL